MTKKSKQNYSVYKELTGSIKIVSPVKYLIICPIFVRFSVAYHVTWFISFSVLGKSEFTHVAMETYITTDTHKCYAMLSPPYQLYTLYNATIPTFAMRFV